MNEAFLRSYASTYVTLYHKISRSWVILGDAFQKKKCVLLDGKYNIYETTKYLTIKRTVLLLTLKLLDPQLDKKFPCVSRKPQVCYWFHKRSPLVPILHQIILVTPSRRICHTQRRLNLCNKTMNGSKGTRIHNSMRRVGLCSTVPRQTLGPVQPSI